MRILVFLSLFMVAAGVRAQSNGSQDSAASGNSRPRWGSYMIQTFPSPAKATDNVTIQFYNHRDETLKCRIYDSDDRPMIELQPKQFTPHGLHTFHIPASSLATGSYFIRLTTYTASDAENIVDNTRFVILH
jgi:hypothetical protein